MKDQVKCRSLAWQAMTRDLGEAAAVCTWDGSGSANALVCRQGAVTGTGEGGDRQAGTLE